MSIRAKACRGIDRMCARLETAAADHGPQQPDPEDTRKHDNGEFVLLASKRRLILSQPLYTVKRGTQ